MRAILPVFAFALALAACNKDKAADEAGAGTTMTADAISSNDVTAIDAVTGEAANMAADVDLNEDMNAALDNELADSAPAPKPATKKSAPKPSSPPPVEQPEATPEPASNSQ